MEKQELKSNILLLITAAIWGFAFVAQRVGTMYVGAFTFNGFRFALGSLSLVPVLIYSNKKSKESIKASEELSSTILGGVIAGCVLFCAAALQQTGLI